MTQPLPNALASPLAPTPTSEEAGYVGPGYKPSYVVFRGLVEIEVISIILDKGIVVPSWSDLATFSQVKIIQGYQDFCKGVLTKADVPEIAKAVALTIVTAAYLL